MFCFSCFNEYLSHVVQVPELNWPLPGLSPLSDPLEQNLSVFHDPLIYTFIYYNRNPDLEKKQNSWCPVGDPHSPGANVLFGLHMLSRSWSLKLGFWVFSIWLGFNLTQTEAKIHVAQYSLSCGFNIAFENTVLAYANMAKASQMKNKKAEKGGRKAFAADKQPY